MIFFTLCLYSQDTDSVNVTIYNSGKYYIKHFKITINGRQYIFNDIWKHKSSKVQRLPYLWNSNPTETTVIVKRFFKYDQWLSVIEMPIDHVGEKKMKGGNCTIYVKTKKKDHKLSVEDYVVRN